MLRMLPDSRRAATIMWEKFTPSAKRIIKYAHEEAKHFNSASVDNEHIILGILRDEECGAMKLLRALKADTEKIREAVVSSITPGEGDIDQLNFSREAKDVLEAGFRSARARKVNSIGSVDLLIGLMTVESNVSVILRNVEVICEGTTPEGNAFTEHSIQQLLDADGEYDDPERGEECLSRSIEQGTRIRAEIASGRTKRSIMEIQEKASPLETIARHTTVIIPAYNEEANIGDVIDRIQALGLNLDILVVDDASTDKTSEVAKSKGVQVIRHPYNKGNGASVKTGIRKATREYILIIDGDGQHPPEEIPNLLKLLPQYELVVGARTRESRTSGFRDLGNFIFNNFASYVAGCKIPDLTSGFRAMPRDVALEFIHLFPNQFSLPTTSTLSVIKSGYSIYYHPIKSEVRKGRSKIRPFKDGVKFLIIIVKIATFFKPLRVFLPMSVFLFLLGLVFGILSSMAAGRPRLTEFPMLCLFSSLLIFFMGLISEQISNLRFVRRD